jgi:hypothetical protein
VRPPTARGLLRGFRVWSSATDAPRLRRPTDILLLVGASLLAAIIGVVQRTSTSASTTAPPPVVEVVDWLSEVGYLLVALWALLLVVLALAARGRRRLLLDFLVGAVTALGVGLLVSRPADGGWTETLRQILTTEPSPVDVVGPLAIGTAIVVIASPHVTRPLRWTGRGLVLLGAVATPGRWNGARSIDATLTPMSGSPWATCASVAWPDGVPRTRWVDAAAMTPTRIAVTPPMG